MLSGLLIRSPYIDWILGGSKSWEIGSATRKRERIALIQSGSGMVVGTADLADVIGPLSDREYLSNARKIGIKKSELSRTFRYERTFAWVLKNPRRLKTPVPYHHPYGSIIWVKLDPDVQAAISRQRRSN
jgi:hypothetical protein